jgi:uncharacterized membrane-anchored protein YhcB (DUF1043 family)
MFLEISILICTFIVVVFSATNPILKEGKERFYKRLTSTGWIFFVSAIILILGIIQVIQNFDDEKEKDKKQEKLQKGLDNVNDCVASASEDLQKSYATSLELREKLRVLDSNTIILISEYQKSFVKLEKLNEQVKKMIADENTKIYAKRPEIYCTALRWKEIKNNLYSLEATFSNIGDRTAENFQVNIVALEADKRMIIAQNFTFDKVLSDDFSFPPTNKSGLDRQVYQGPLNIDLKSYNFGFVIALVKFSYEDFITKEKKEKIDHFIWENWETDSIVFRTPGIVIKDTAIEYIKKQNIKL